MPVSVPASAAVVSRAATLASALQPRHAMLRCTACYVEVQSVHSSLCRTQATVCSSVETSQGRCADVGRGRGRAGQGRAGQGRAGQGKAGPRAGQGNAAQGRTNACTTRKQGCTTHDMPKPVQVTLSTQAWVPDPTLDAWQQQIVSNTIQKSDVCLVETPVVFLGFIAEVCQAIS